MNTKHTAGPWYCSKNCVVRDVKSDSPIAFPRLPEPRDLSAEEKANLVLCSAAPDLLGVCLNMADILMSGRDMYDAEGRPTDETNKLFESMKSAITMATESSPTDAPAAS